MVTVLSPPLAARATAASAVAAAPLAPARLLLPQQYIADATAAIAAARTRVRITTLTIADDQRTGALIDALAAAARRGVDVRVAADVFTYADAAGTFLPRRYRTRRQRESSALATRLTDAGVRFAWLGSERGLIWRGRTHTKLCVVDDVAYAFGGVNLDHQGTSNVDYMLRLPDPLLADQLTAVYGRIVRMNACERGHRSAVLERGEDAVLVDGGMPGESVIYDRALALAQRAEHVLLVSQYCPTGPLGRAIAQRPHQLWFNPPRNASPANRALITGSMAATGYRTRYRSPRYLHAKCLVFTMADGPAVAITGSHNFVVGGVRLGTREIALETRSPALIEQLLAFHRAQVAAHA